MNQFQIKKIFCENPNFYLNKYRMAEEGSKNTLLTIILFLLILITIVMIFNLYGMRVRVEEADAIPQCKGSNDLDLMVKIKETAKKSVQSESSPKSAPESAKSSPERATELINRRVGDYSDGSISSELKKEMIKQYKQDKINKLNEQSSQNQSGQKQTKENFHSNSSTNLTKKQSDNGEPGKVKLCIYHMQGCGHCHNIMDVPQESGKTTFEELKEIFKNKQNVEVLDFQAGRDPEASKYTAFPVIMLVKENTKIEHNGHRTTEQIARFIIQNM